MSGNGEDAVNGPSIVRRREDDLCRAGLQSRRAYAARPLVGALAVVWRGDRVLLVRRRSPPQADEWGFPGGGLDFGETVAEAALRELREETGIEAEATEVLTAVDLLDRDPVGCIRYHYVLIAVLAEYRSGQSQPRDDVTEARWFSPDDLPTPLCADVAAVVESSHRCRSVPLGEG